MEVKTGIVKHMVRTNTYEYDWNRLHPSTDPSNGYHEVPIRGFQLDGQTIFWDTGGWYGADLKISENDRVAVVGRSSGGILEVFAYKNFTQGIPCRVHTPVQQALIPGFIIAILVILLDLSLDLPKIWGWAIMAVWAIYPLYMSARNYWSRRLLSSIS